MMVPESVASTRTAIQRRGEDCLLFRQPSAREPAPCNVGVRERRVNEIGNRSTHASESSGTRVCAGGCCHRHTADGVAS